jgi:hypothetical protein
LWYHGNFGAIWLFKDIVNANGTFPLLEWKGNSWLHVLFGSAMVTRWVGVEWFTDQFGHNQHTEAWD